MSPYPSSNSLLTTLTIALLASSCSIGQDKNNGQEPDTGHRSQPEGAYPGECNDGADNDFDGDFDCNDSDCSNSADCNENFADGDCSDGADNDRDGLFDCDDPDCADDAACATEDNCTDGADNDLDGLFDCDDPDCAEDAACIEYEGDDAGECSDGIDNDGDGDTDCDDADCEGSPDCEASDIGTESNPGLSCNDILTEGGSNGDGTYWIDPNGSGAFEVYCDMNTDAGGWSLILAYGRSSTSSNGIDESKLPLHPTTGFSHMWLTDAGIPLEGVNELRFFCTSSGHSRVMHFKTSRASIVGMADTGSGTASVSDWTDGTTELDGHTANLPASTNTAHPDSSLTLYPFYNNPNYHWAIDGQHGSGWECDEPHGSSNDTLHQIWFR